MVGRQTVDLRDPCQPRGDRQRGGRCQHMHFGTVALQRCDERLRHHHVANPSRPDDEDPHPGVRVAVGLTAPACANPGVLPGAPALARSNGIGGAR